ncbi:MAG TPA: hypothetical protein VFI47_13285 [Acidimicrobiales bacterium]|nr:hypothetical protein [Acidimicrobiales bacterium]
MDSTDHLLVHQVARTLARPKDAPADSFVLHAALELLARAGLLPHVRVGEREAARARLRALAASYDAAGDPVEDPRPAAPDPERLVAALVAGDLDEVDAQAVAVARVATPGEVRRLLAAPTLASLGAAAHGSILLHLLVRTAAPLGLPLGLLRQALREMARYPTWHLRWFEDPQEPAVTAALGEALLDVPHLGLPGSDFIFPIMSQAEESGIAPRLLGGITTTPARAERDLARVAAWSMLQEPDEHVAYGWTHCLTMPQGAVRLADVADHAVQVAATYVVGFRAAEGTVALDPTAGVDPAADPADLASYAAAHEDAHLAKYTLACFDAAAQDPEMRHLYLAAATRLAAWWRAEDERAATPEARCA